MTSLNFISINYDIRSHNIELNVELEPPPSYLQLTDLASCVPPDAKWAITFDIPDVKEEDKFAKLFRSQPLLKVLLEQMMDLAPAAKQQYQCSFASLSHHSTSSMKITPEGIIYNIYVWKKPAPQEQHPQCSVAPLKIPWTYKRKNGKTLLVQEHPDLIQKHLVSQLQGLRSQVCLVRHLMYYGQRKALLLM